MRIAVASDLHLGSRHCMHEQFVRFLRSLPADAVLVLNGDVIDIERQELPEQHRDVLAAICEESLRRRIVWTGGNHDDGFLPELPSRIELVQSWSVGSVYFCHGDEFLPMRWLYRQLSKLVRLYRVCKPAESLLTLKLAFSIPFLFPALKRMSIWNAVRFARRRGYDTVVCGHLHSVIDTTARGIRYLNTGSWTEWPAYYLWMEDGNAVLRDYSKAG